MRCSFRPAGWLLLLGVLAVLVAADRRLLFLTPFHEDGDYAVDALQIDQAKAFREIHGNYSRFNFDHPGPAFFYVYALGEALFRGPFRLVASAAAAHVLAGLILQAGFFVLALRLLARWFRAPLFLPLALLACAIHFSLARTVFVSIWPPDVLAVPFLAFIVACASIAAGGGQDLPWAVLAGSFLVHGHAAQPLFVVVLFAVAYLRLPGKRQFRRAHLISFAVLAVFLLPLALDLFQGSQGNFAAIHRHLRYDESERKPLSDSILYFLSFFGYLRDQETRFGLAAPGRLSFLRDHALAYAVWAAILGFVLFTLFRRRGPVPRPVRRFGRILLLFIALAVLLCLEWGRLQTGPMFDFNGHFYYGLIGALLLLACGLFVEAKPPSPVAAALLCLAAAAIGYAGLRTDTGAMENALPTRAAALAALRADPHPGWPKLLVFSHDDWGTAASVGLALERAGAKFYVDPYWTFMFQRAHAAPLDLWTGAHPRASIWRLLDGAAGRPALPLGDGEGIAFAPGRLAPIGGRIEFSKDGNFQDFVLCGFVTPDADAAWTDLADAAIQFQPIRAKDDVLVTVAASPFLCGNKVREQPVAADLNGFPVGRSVMVREGALAFIIPKARWNARPVAILHFHLPNARSPAELGLSGDPRRLGLSVRSIRTGPVSRPRPDGRD